MKKLCLSLTLFFAVRWISRQPRVKADPEELLEFCKTWVLASEPATVAECRQCGEAAARDCAIPIKSVECDLIEPGDLQ